MLAASRIVCFAIAFGAGAAAWGFLSVRAPAESGEALIIDDLPNSLAHDLALALLVHDRSVRSLDWVQVLRLESGTPRELPWKTHQVFDGLGHWACDYEKCAWSGGGEVTPITGRQVAFSGTVRGYQDQGESGVIQDNSGDRRGEVGIDCFLGRHLDISGQKRLGEYLLAASDLALVRHSTRGFPVLRASVVLNEVTAELEVEVDPDHGFAPREIVVRDRAIRVPYWRYETTEFVQAAGIWLPKHGRLVTRKFRASPDDRALLAEALSKRGLDRKSDSLSPAVQQAYATAIREAFDSDEAPSVDLVPPMDVDVISIEMNPPLDISRFDLEFPLAYTIYDSYRDVVRKKGSTDWQRNGKED